MPIWIFEVCFQELLTILLKGRLVNAYFLYVWEFCCILGQLFNFFGKRRKPDKQNRYIRQNKTSSEMWEDIVKDINYSFTELQESFIHNLQWSI